MRKTIAIISLCAAMAAKAETDAYYDFCTNATAKLAECKEVQPCFTNTIQNFIASADGVQLDTARVLLAVAMFNIFEQTLDDSAWAACHDACTNVINNQSTPVISWQKSVAAITLATAYAQDGCYAEAFNVCTNALDRHLDSPASAWEAPMWPAMTMHNFVAGLSITNSLNLIAASAKLMESKTADVSAYTNGLPQSAMAIIEILSNR